MCWYIHMYLSLSQRGRLALRAHNVVYMDAVLHVFIALTATLMRDLKPFSRYAIRHNKRFTQMHKMSKHKMQKHFPFPISLIHMVVLLV